MTIVPFWRQLSVLFVQIPPPWKPDVVSPADTKYIPEEFKREKVELTPPGKTDSPLESFRDDKPYFETFSFHGSRTSLNSFLSTSSADLGNF